MSVASAPGLVRKVRSPPASTMVSTKPVSTPVLAGWMASMPSAASAARARVPNGPVP